MPTEGLEEPGVCARAQHCQAQHGHFSPSSHHYSCKGISFVMRLTLSRWDSQEVELLTAVFYALAPLNSLPLVRSNPCLINGDNIPQAEEETEAGKWFPVAAAS